MTPIQYLVCKRALHSSCQDYYPHQTITEEDYIRIYIIHQGVLKIKQLEDKSQLILKCLYGVIISTKIATKIL